MVNKTGRIEWDHAPDVEKRVKTLIKRLNLEWIEPSNIHFFRSNRSKTRAFARIWGLSRIWQQALKNEPSYIIEVVSEKYDRLKMTERDRVLLHELAHIPNNFSGALLPHYRKGKRSFRKRVKGLINIYKKKT